MTTSIRKALASDVGALIDQIVGYAVCRDNLIDLMMIDHVLHRRGFGTELLSRVEKMLGLRYEELWLESFKMNQRANAFYRKNGWVEVERYFDKDFGVSKIVFRKWIRCQVR